jgi:hypothetical protein
LVLCLLLTVTGVSVADLSDEWENFRYHWKLYGSDYRRGWQNHNGHLNTHQLPVSIEGDLETSLSSGLFHFNATGSLAGSQATINVEADILGGSITAWTTVDVTRRLLRHLPLPHHFARFFSGAQMKDCISLKINADRTMIARKLEQIRQRIHHVWEAFAFSVPPKCYLDGVKSICVGDHFLFTLGLKLRAFVANRHALLKFSDYQEWKGPLDSRPECGRTVDNVRLVAPALQFMALSLPDSEFKAGVQDLIADMSDIEQQDQGALNIPTAVGVFVAFGVSIISIIAGFALGQRSRVRNLDSDYERVGA